MSKKVVLGAGPVGLVAAHLLRADACLGEKPGGGGAVRGVAPTYLWRTPSTERLLTELGLDWAPRVARFGWLLPGGRVADEANAADRAEYYRRSRGNWTQAFVEMSRVPESVASSGKRGFIETFDVTVDDLVRELLGRVEVFPAVVREVTRSGASEALVESSETARVFRADTVVNTLPAPVWDAVAPTLAEPYGRRRWEAGPKCWVVGGAWDSRLVGERGEREFLYCADPEVPFDRVTILRSEEPERRFSYEFNSEAPPEGFLDAVCGALAAAGRFQITGETRQMVEWGGLILHVGRLARWDHSIRLHDVTEEIYGL